VAGLWIVLLNPGINRPFKWIGMGDEDPEPVNFVNVTPHENWLYVSGGYTYVGDATVEEAKEFVQPVLAKFFEQAKWWLRLRGDATLSEDQWRVCLRPVFPDSGPHIGAVDSRFGNVVVNRGHGAGGFTQAPASAELVVRALGLSPSAKTIAAGGARSGISV